MLEIDCSVGEGGGGLIRVSLPLAVLTGQPLELLKIRSRRDPATRGIGWTHLAFIEAICALTGSRAEFSGLGATRLIFIPGSRHIARQLTVNLDDPERTFTTGRISVTRDYLGGSDHFLENIDNRNGRGIRGHSVAMFLIGLLPLFATSDSLVIRGLGSTETPGGPFIDAIKHCLYPAASRMVGRGLDCHVGSRGCMGIGGGEVLATLTSSRRAAAGPGSGPAEGEEPVVETTYYVFGDSAFHASASARLLKVHDQVEAGLAKSIKADVVHVPYQARRVQTIFLIKTSCYARDVSICWEEGWGLTRYFVEVCKSRVGAELRFSGLTSRFIVEQLLPLMAVTSGVHRFETEALTNHAISVMHVIEALTATRIRSIQNGRSVTLIVESG